MKDQVLSIEQMQHLKDLGIDTSKASMFWDIPNPPCYRQKLSITGIYGNLKETEYRGHIIGAFTLQDMFDLLPENLIIDCNRYFLEIHHNNSKKVQIKYKTYQYENTLICLGDFPNIMTATYEMLCWLAENGYMKTT